MPAKNQLTYTLNQIEREILDLKTSHERGIGLINFYRYQTKLLTVAQGHGFRIRAVAADGEVVPFMIQLSANLLGALVYGQMRYEDGGRVFIYEDTVGPLEATRTIQVACVSTARLDSFTLEAI